MKRLILVGLSVLLMVSGIFTINCKNGSEGSKTSVGLNDSVFVEIVAKQGLMMQKYQLQGQQAESDSARKLISDAFKKEMEEMLSDYGISEEEFKSYAQEIQTDTQRVKELQKRIINKTRAMMMEKSEAAGKEEEGQAE